MRREGDCGDDVRNKSDIIYETVIPYGQPTRDGGRKIYEGMILTSPFGTLGLRASL